MKKASAKVVPLQAWLEKKAKLFEKSKQYKEAADTLSRLLVYLTRSPQSEPVDVSTLAAIHYRLGLAHRALRDTSKSIYHLKYSIRLNASEPRYYEAFGKAFLNNGHWKVAKTQFEMAVQLDPKNVTYLRQYAWVLLMMEKKTEALSTIKKALAAKPRDRETHWMYVRILMEMGHFIQALAHLKKLKTTSTRKVLLLEECLEKLEGTFEGAVLWWLRRGLVCDGDPFTLRHIRQAEQRWIDFCVSSEAVKLQPDSPQLWAAAIAWCIAFEGGLLDAQEGSMLFERFSVSLMEVWPVIRKLSEGLILQSAV